MNLLWTILLVLSVSWAAAAQQQLPPGTVLPVRLNNTLSTNHTRPNESISASVMQDVPFPNGKIRKGTKIFGHIEAVHSGVQGWPASISFVFDTLSFSGRKFVLATDLRALAGIEDVAGAYIPQFGMGESDSWASRTTQQVGRDIVYWGGGPVVGPNGRVGKPLNGANAGVLVEVSANPQGECRGPLGDSQRFQAFWVFSSGACGVYGIDDVRIAHAGKTPPLGLVRLDSDHRDLKVPSGSGMLLRVISVND